MSGKTLTGLSVVESDATVFPISELQLISWSEFDNRMLLSKIRDMQLRGRMDAYMRLIAAGRLTINDCRVNESMLRIEESK